MVDSNFLEDVVRDLWLKIYEYLWLDGLMACNSRLITDT
jgi:hypothetical protein